WEAHEAWEHVWIALGRFGDAADHIKGLIKLAAAGVKCLEGNTRGATRHANRALELLSGPLRLTFEPRLDWNQLQEWARSIAAVPPVLAEEELEACRSGGVPVLGQLTITD
ncbi:MAG: DUF309 domain-containing protein, partial [Planctomycetaceae bacterium]|nr:DUF309 domain-containing protein [Planctomycetaceae bacterium]